MVEVNFDCESDIKPDSYIIEYISDGKCDIVLHDNVREKSREESNGEIKTFYTYDTYRIIKNNYRDTLEEDLEDKTIFDMWLNFAKEQYKNQAEDISLEERLSVAEAVITEILSGEV